MPDVSVARIIRASAPRAWDTLIDTWQWPRWGPSVRAVDCADRYLCAGSRGQVQTAVGLWLPFTVTAFEADRYWRWQVGGIAATGHRVECLTATSCRVSFEIPVVAAPYSIICKIALQRIAHLLEPAP